MPQEMGVRGIQEGFLEEPGRSQGQEIQRQVGAQKAEFTVRPLALESHVRPGADGTARQAASLKTAN